MAKALTKEEIRRNPLAEWVASALRTVQERRALVAGIAAILMVGAAGIGAYTWYQAQKAHEAQGLLVKAYSAMWGDSAGAKRNPDEATKVYAEIAAKYAGTVAAEESLVRLGNLQFEGGKHEEAAGTYANYLAAYPRGRFRVMAGIGQAYAQEKKGDPAAGEKTLSELLESVKDDPLAGEAYTSLAHLYEVTKKPEDAIRIYSQIAERFPQTHWAQNALQRMSALKTK